MGPSTGTPHFFLLMVTSVVLGLVLLLFRWKSAALVVLSSGVGLFILHRIAVWVARRQFKRASNKGGTGR